MFYHVFLGDLKNLKLDTDLQKYPIHTIGNYIFLVCWPYSGHAPYRLLVFPFLDFGDWKAGGRQEIYSSEMWFRFWYRLGYRLKE
jgi:hypothetical protein